MSLSIAMKSAVSGMHASTRHTAAIAHNVANVYTPGYARQVTSLSTIETGSVYASVSQAQDGSGVDLGTEMLDLIGAGLSFKANASVFEAGADMWDVLMTVVKD